MVGGHDMVPARIAGGIKGGRRRRQRSARGVKEEEEEGHVHGREEEREASFVREEAEIAEGI